MLIAQRKLLVQISIENALSVCSLTVLLYRTNYRCALVEDFPNLREILQGYANRNILQIDVPEEFEKEHGTKPRSNFNLLLRRFTYSVISLRTIKRYTKSLGVVTVRLNDFCKEDKELAVDLISKDDPLERWGGRLIKEKLGLKTIQISRFLFIFKFTI